MQLDPTRSLVAVAGFGYDWIITREWKQVVLAMIPAVLFTFVAGMVLYGQNLNRNQLARWYMDLGEEEVKDWENAWAGGKEADEQADEQAEEQTDESADAESQSATEANDENKDEESAQKISKYADMLFRRVQMLSPTDRSQFIIGVNLAQSGAISQGKEMLTKVAPNEKSGYAPAHAFLALIYEQEERVRPLKEIRELRKHHISEATRWERVPQDVLIRGAGLYLVEADRTASADVKRTCNAEALRLLTRAAENDPAVSLQLFKLAKSLGNKRSEELSFRKTESYFKSRLAENEKDDKARIALAELYAGDNRLDDAELILAEGAQIERTDLISRGLSEVYRLKFRQTRMENSGAANILLLDMAMRHDPTNPMVVQEIADIARVQGPRPNEEMIEKLQEVLAAGQATALTHAWISEAYLNRGQYEKALPHLEQVVTKLPNAAQYLNNLAFVLTELHPDRLEDALQFARRAVAAASKSPNADYFDTLGLVHSKLGQSKEAIAAFETAIELKPKRTDFHENAAVEYEKLGNQAMADNHRKFIAKIEQEESQEAKGEVNAPQAKEAE